MTKAQQAAFTYWYLKTANADFARQMAKLY